MRRVLSNPAHLPTIPTSASCVCALVLPFQARICVSPLLPPPVAHGHSRAVLARRRAWACAAATGGATSEPWLVYQGSSCKPRSQFTMHHAAPLPSHDAWEDLTDVYVAFLSIQIAQPLLLGGACTRNTVKQPHGLSQSSVTPPTSPCNLPQAPRSATGTQYRRKCILYCTGVA